MDLEMQQTLKTHFALNLSAYNKFYQNCALKGFFGSEVTLRKLFWFYMSIWTYVAL